MSNHIAARLWSLFSRKRVESAQNPESEGEHPDAHAQVERAALYARHGYFNSSFAPLLFPFVPEIPLE
ncbi:MULTISPECIES: hypothetical protein [unclassified Paraburkholderia]|uniref:hypothetical protein n=1 Tax=unclassified Paraburkholderia TaxID=2615204 RepID=UPI00197F35BC|nr:MULTISPECIES: hypothetical protein [unclassified Paraburkholderia]MBN3855090.1 hypothetical protein [Paraburkholderia sp. Ac-20340]